MSHASEYITQWAVRGHESVAAHLVSVVVACGGVDVAVVVEFTVVELRWVNKWRVADALECSGCFQHRSHSLYTKGAFAACLPTLLAP
jgi:hypothetical protein